MAARRKKGPATDEEISLRTLPHDLAAEKSVLGALLINPAVMERVMPVLSGRAFFRRAHMFVFEAMVDLVMRNEAIDPLTLTAELRRQSKLDECGGRAYIAALTDGVPRSTNAEHYAQIVKAHFARRQIITMANEMLVEAYDAEVPVADMLANGDRAIIDLQRGTEAERMVDLRTTAGLLYEDLENLVANKGRITGVDTGFQSLNDITLGWQPSDLIVLAARPSMGKTLLTLNLAVSAARAGHRVAIFSLEMRRKQLEYRLLSSLSGMPLTRIKTGFIGEADFEKLNMAMASLHELPLFVDDRGRQTFWDIRTACRKLRSEGGLGLIIIDYVQLMSGTLDRKGANRNDEITDISRRLKEFADEIGCPIILLSQLNRGAETRSDKRPVMADLRESGALEQDADIIAFLHRKHHRESGPTSLIIDKQRNGEGGTLTLMLDRDTQTFADGGIEPEQAPLPQPTPADPAPKPPRGWRN